MSIFRRSVEATPFSVADARHLAASYFDRVPGKMYPGLDRETTSERALFIQFVGKRWERLASIEVSLRDLTLAALYREHLVAIGVLVDERMS